MKLNKIFVLIVLALFVFSAMPVEATSLKELDQAFLTEYNLIKAKYTSATSEYKTAREQYKTFKDKLSQYKDSEKGTTVFDRTQEFLTNALEVLDTHNDVLIHWAENIEMSEDLRENILEDLEYHTEKLAELKQDVEGAETVQDLITVARSIKDHYDDQRVAIKRVSGILLSARADHVLARADKLSENLQTRLDAVESDADKVEIQSLLDDFSTKVALAQSKYDKARETYSSIDDPSEANELFNQANEFFKEANGYVWEARESLIQAIRLYRSLVEDEFELSELTTGVSAVSVPDSVRLRGTGTLTASGDGWAQISGTGDITLSGSGYITVRDLMGEGSIETVGFGVITQDGSSTRYETEEGEVGTITITDANSISVYFSGTELEAEVIGTGSAHFYGSGEYCVNGNCGDWPIGFDVTSGNDGIQE